MSGWADFWKIVASVAIASYFGLAIVISIGGFFDVKRMFRLLGQARDRPGDGPRSPAFPVDDSDRLRSDV